MDKIGMEGVASELSEAGYEKAKIDQYLALFGSVTPDAAGCLLYTSLFHSMKPQLEP